jgi:MFS superfamily sulfate permease-like transporter
MGIAIGIFVNFAVHLKNGAPPRSLLKTQVVVERHENEGVMVRVKDSAIFSTWIGLKKTLEPLMKEPQVVLDLSETFLVDHTVMAKLQEMEKVFQENGSTLVIAGLDQHQRLSNHPAAARKRPRK